MTSSWFNAENAGADDATYATAAPAENGSVTNDWHGFGFDSVIPSGAVINGVTIEWEFKVSTTGSVAHFYRTWSFDASATVATEVLDDTEPLADKIVSSAPNGVTRNNLLDANLRVRARAHRPSGATSYTCSLDFVRVTVTYNEDTTPPAVPTGLTATATTE